MISSAKLLIFLAFLSDAILSAISFSFVPVSYHGKKNLENANIGYKRAPTLSMGLTLYGSPGSRSPLVDWAAYELDVPFSRPPSLQNNPHPFGQIPCLVNDDDGSVVFESGAILLYLLSLADGGQDNKRLADITSWVVWANASLDPICFLETPEGKVYDTGLKKPNRKIDKIDQILSSQRYLVGEDFTTADVAVASYLLYVPQFFRGIDLSRWPNVVRYMKDCADRENYGKAFGIETQKYLLQQMENMSNNGGEKKLFGLF